MYSPEEKTIIATDCLYNMNPKFSLDYWQQWRIENNPKYLITNKSRRIGWSFIEAGNSSIEAQHEDVYRYEKVFVSYGMRDAVAKIRDARMFYMSMRDTWKKDLKTDSKTQLEFWDKGRKSVSSLVSIPNQSLRGFGTTNDIGGVSLDEFAFHRNDLEVYVSAIPCLVRGGTLSIGSTPLAKSGQFYEILAGLNGKYQDFQRLNIYWWMSSVLCTNVLEAIDLAPEMTTEQRVMKYGSTELRLSYESMALSSFMREFECVFTDESDAFISMEMILSCTQAENPRMGTHEQYHYENISEFINGVTLRDVCVGLDELGNPIYETITAPGYDPAIHGALYAGWDMGRTKDASIFTLMGIIRGQNVIKKHVWMSYELKNKSFDEQKAFAENAMNLLPVHRFLIDKTGLGMDFGEWAEKKWPRVAEGIFFTSESKEKMALKMYLGFENKEFELPMDQKLHADIHCIRQTVTLSKHIRYDGSTKDSHADRFWSMALANLGVIDTMDNRSRFYKDRRDRNTRGNKQLSGKPHTGSPELNKFLRAAQRNTRRILKDE